MKKKLVILIIILMILLLLGFIFKDIIFVKKAVISNSNSEISIKYPSLSFKYDKDKQTVTSKDTIITFNIKDDLDENTTYELLSGYKKMAYNGQIKKYASYEGLYCYNNKENRYEIMIKIDDKSYVDIYIESKEKNKIEETINSKKVQKILQSINIEK